MATETDTSGAAYSGHEPSYYEIALTNRQVVFAFIILLVCLVAAFFSGVWVGTRGEERAAAARAQLQAEKNDKVSPEGQSLEEFKFFAKPGEGQGKEGNGKSGKPGSQRAGDDETPAAAPHAGDNAKPGKTTPAEDVAKGAEAPPPQPAPAQASPPAPQPPPAAAHPTPPPAKGTAKAPEPADHGSDATIRPRTVPEAPAAASPATHPGDVIIQVFSSADEDQADKVRDRLVKSGQKAFLSPIDKGGRTMYRVRIGPFSSRDSAEKVAEKVRKEQRLDTWVTVP